MPFRIVRMMVLFLVCALVFFFGFGQAVLHLWNWLMPQVFGLRMITFWQGIGLLCLSWLLFGGFGWFGRGASHRMDGRSWSRMTPEQRANAREAWRAWSRMSREERQAFWAEVCARAAARSASQPGAGPGTGSPA